MSEQNGYEVERTWHYGETTGGYFGDSYAEAFAEYEATKPGLIGGESVRIYKVTGGDHTLLQEWSA